MKRLNQPQCCICGALEGLRPVTRLFVFKIVTVCLNFALLTLPAAAQSVQAIYCFTNGSANPYGGLVQGPDGNFYGTTYNGGANSDGTVFRVTTNGTLTTIASFAGTNGANPYAALTPGPDGNLYGTTFNGGMGLGFGTAFRITTNGALTSLYSFSPVSANTNADGANPNAALTLGPDGNFYGTTERGGSNGYGTVFRMTTNGALTNLATFANTNGAYPYAALTLGSAGNFYGTTANGGSSNFGTVFQFTTNGALTTLASFAFANGADPYAGLAFAPDGNLYGATYFGVSNDNGGVFQITTNGTLTVLAAFENTNGANPYSALTLGPDNNFYGTTYGGGSSSNGTVFRITTNGTLTMLASFAGTNGANPYASLTLGPDGSFYGTTFGGGPSNSGVIYRLNLPPCILTQPSNQNVVLGSNATFSVALFGTVPFAYQWLSNSAPISNATNSTLTVPSVTSSSTGNFQVVITNGSGSVTSAVASLTVSPTITNQPGNQSVGIGGTARFAVGAGGTPSLAYQWYFNTNTLLVGATKSTLTFGPVLTNQAGQYQVIVTSPYGGATSSVATLAVLLQPDCYGISNSGGGSVTLLLASSPGSTNRVWASTNLSLPLAQWLPISTNTAAASGFFQLIDSNVSGSRAKFYILSSP